MGKKLIATVISLGVLGVGGYVTYNYAMNMIADKIAHQLVAEGGASEQWLESIELPAMNETTGVLPSVTPATPEGSKATTGANSTESSAKQSTSANPSKESPSTAKEDKKVTPTEKKEALQFENKQEAVKFVMSRFSATELNKLRQMASGGLTSEKKAELKKIAYSKFTSAEIAAVQKVVSSQ